MKQKFITEENKDYKILDTNTGELLELKQTKKVSIDEFILIFFQCFPEVFKLEGNQLKILMCIWKMSSYNSENQGNLFTNNKMFKDYVKSTGLNMSDGAINLYITQLAKTNILIKKCRGTYMLNPNYFFKGTLSDRTKINFNISVDNK